MEHKGNFIHTFSEAEKQMSDDVLIRKVTAGYSEHFEIIIRRYNERLYHIARAYLQEQTEIEDVMQETYITAFEKLSQFKFKAQFSTWLIRILINNSLARVKQMNKSSTVDIDLLIKDEDENFLGKVREQSHEYEVIRRNYVRILENSIDQLPEKYRVVFVMRIVEKLNLSDTALCLGISPENVKIRLFRAKKILKEQLSKSINATEVFGFYLDKCDRITFAVLSHLKLI